MTAGTRAQIATLSGEELDAAELIASRLIDPITGYRLPGDHATSWPAVRHLRVTDALAESALAAGTLEIRDPDTTPVALLRLSAARPVGDGTAWVAGEVSPLRRFEHGPFRPQRFSAADDLSGRRVALFRGEVRPADILGLGLAATDLPIDLVLQGTSDGVSSARLMGQLRDAAAMLPDSQVFFIPDVRLSPHVDVAMLVLRGRGAEDVRDLRRADARESGGAVLLLTGLSGSGKSTIARALTDRIREISSRRVVLLDGDHVRAELASELGFSAEDRDRNLQRQAWVAARVAEAGGLAVCAPIAPFAQTRAAMRAKVEPTHPFLLVHVATPLSVAEGRDRKGLYAKARAGLIKDFTGIDSPYEVPDDADLRLDTTELSVEACVAAVIDLLRRRQIIDEEDRGGVPVRSDLR